MNHSSIRLLESYLSDRRQRVKVGNIHVAPGKKISKRVPQESIRNLFNMFIKDMCIKECDLYNYADNCSQAQK